MNSSNSVVRKAYWRFPKVVWVSLVVGMGIAGMAAFQYGGSTATIEQRAVPGKSHSHVIRDKDGQTIIITQDGSNTDITVHRGSGSASPDDQQDSPLSAADRFDRGGIEQRLSRLAPERGNTEQP